MAPAFSLSVSPDSSLLTGVAGGLVIALSSTGLMALAGKVSGMSGIIGSLVSGEGDGTWRVSYVVGLLAAGAAFARLSPAALGQAGGVTPLAVAAGGLLVGLGTRLGSGCTSGHGVCGLPRLSPRSAVAVGSFMAAGMLTASVTSSATHAVAVSGTVAAAGPALASPWFLVPAAGAAAAMLALRARRRNPPQSAAAAESAAESGLSMHAAGLASGALFGLGLGLSGMTDPARVTGFLHPFRAGGWDVTLAGVMGGAVAANLLTWHWLARSGGSPVFAPAKGFRDLIKTGATGDNLKVDARLLVGAALFGAGWGLVGICPGPAVVALGALTPVAVLFVPWMLLGMAAYEFGPGTPALAKRC